ncbi:hypothetical protein [Roseobacter sp.]|uniref:hypothetical protein n=1 Tax=Roseobacter sp. TaxID=1907202 RepID=UPI0025DDD498|nr:hypothetical protein [Roseobacter sp.]
MGFGNYVRQGTGSGSKLLIGDLSEIALSARAYVPASEYRIALLSRPGDRMLVHNRNRAFEAYLTGYLGLSDVTFHQCDTGNLVPVTKQAWATPRHVDVFAPIARQHEGLTLLPLPSEGPPQPDGLFEQRVRTSMATFAGAAPSSLPDTVRTRIGSQDLRIARVLQRLGYYGRCSLDAVLCQNASEPPTIHWIGCNGRWGGVSIALTAARQLT